MRLQRARTINGIRKSLDPCKREVMSLKTEKIWLDGELVRWEEAKVHVLAHALHYGTAYFEGIRCYALADGRSAVFRLEEHMRRFADSGKILGFPLPYTVEQGTDLFRFRRLLDLRDRRCAYARFSSQGQLPFPVRRYRLFRFLAALAHIAVHISARLPLHSTRG